MWCFDLLQLYTVSVLLLTLSTKACKCANPESISTRSDHDAMLSELWQEHLKYEFEPTLKNTDKTMATMVDEPYVNHIPTMVGGVGKEFLRQFYHKHFIHTNPPMTFTPISRTIGTDQLVDEMVVDFDHSTVVDWLIPNVPPTNAHVRIPLVAIVKFQRTYAPPDDNGAWKIAHEHIYWDQASVLRQVGVLDASYDDHVTGSSQADKALDPNSHPSNQMLRRKFCSPNAAESMIAEEETRFCDKIK